MSKEQQKPVEAIPNKKNNPSMDDLYALMGIEASQVDTSKGIRRTKTREILTNADALKDKSVKATKEVNLENGTHIKFACVVRKGSLKDANGKVKKDNEGKPIPRYEPATKTGYFVIDKIEEDGVTFFEVTRALQYTESFKVADYSEL